MRERHAQNAEAFHKNVPHSGNAEGVDEMPQLKGNGTLERLRAQPESDEDEVNHG